MRSRPRSFTMSPKCEEIIHRLVAEGWATNESEAVRLCILTAGQLFLGDVLRLEMLEALKGFRCPRCHGPLRKVAQNTWECVSCGRWWKLKMARKSKQREAYGDDEASLRARNGRGGSPEP